MSLDDFASALGLKRSRMQHALVLVGKDRVNIKTIAFMVGFKNVGSFRRAFHESTGQSTAER